MQEQSLFSVLRGSVSFSGAGNRNVTFSSALEDANYVIYVEPTNTETFSISNKTTTGFRISSSNSASTETVNWVKL